MKDIWHLVPSGQDMCSTCHTTTWRPARMCLGNCRTTTWCPPPSFRSTAPAPGPPAALPSSLNSSTAGMVSFHDPWPQCLTANSFRACLKTCKAKARADACCDYGKFTDFALESLLSRLIEYYICLKKKRCTVEYFVASDSLRSMQSYYSNHTELNPEWILLIQLHCGWSLEESFFLILFLLKDKQFPQC